METEGPAADEIPLNEETTRPADPPISAEQAEQVEDDPELVERLPGKAAQSTDLRRTRAVEPGDGDESPPEPSAC